MLLSLNPIKVFIMEVALGAAITGLFGMIQSDENRAAQLHANRLQFDQNKLLMQYQNELQMRTWQSQQNAINEYNSPSEQIKRLSEAGINPNSMGDVQGNYSSVSPEASVGLASTSPAAATSTYGDSFARAMEQLLQGKGLGIQQQDADTRKKEAESSIAVQAQQIDNLIKEGNLSDSQKAEVDKRVSQMDEMLNLKVKDVQAKFEDNKIKLLQTFINAYTSDWQKGVAERNASTNEQEARTHSGQLNLANRELAERIRQFDKSYQLKLKEYNEVVRSHNIDSFYKMVDATGIKLLGTTYSNAEWLQNGYALLETYVHNSSDFSPAAQVKLAPAIEKLADIVQSKLDSLIELPVDNFKVDKSPYFNNNDMSDGFVPDSSLGY